MVLVLVDTMQCWHLRNFRYKVIGRKGMKSVGAFGDANMNTKKELTVKIERLKYC